MPFLSAYEKLPFSEQLLHGAHFMICSFAVLIACVPLLTSKGSPEHKFAGLIYLPVSLVALLLASFMAWNEQSAILFCFNCFCAYLLISGWRAVHQKGKPHLIDWLIPGGLVGVAALVTVKAFFLDDGMRTFYLLFFAFNAFYLAGRDYQYLRNRSYWEKHRAFFADISFGPPRAVAWMGRHVAGMVGSMLANLSVVVLTLLPIELHWLWPVSLLLIGARIAQKERLKKIHMQKILAPVLQGKFRPAAARKNEDIRRAA